MQPTDLIEYMASKKMDGRLLWLGAGLAAGVLLWWLVLGWAWGLLGTALAVSPFGVWAFGVTRTPAWDRRWAIRVALVVAGVLAAGLVGHMFGGWWGLFTWLGLVGGQGGTDSRMRQLLDQADGRHRRRTDSIDSQETQGVKAAQARGADARAAAAAKYDHTAGKVQTMTDNELRDGILGAVRSSGSAGSGVVPWSLFVLLVIPLIGCTTSRHTHRVPQTPPAVCTAGDLSCAPPVTQPPPRTVCFTRAEAQQIRLKLAAQERDLAQARATCREQAGVAKAQCKARVARRQSEIQRTQDKLNACQARKCPTCTVWKVALGGSLALGAGLLIYTVVSLLTPHF